MENNACMIKGEKVGNLLVDLGFYKDGDDIIPFSCPKIFTQGKIHVIEYSYGPRSLKGYNGYYFVIKDGEIIDNPGFVVSNYGQVIDLRGYSGNPLKSSLGILPFQDYITSMIIPLGSPEYRYICQATGNKWGVSFIRLPVNEEEYHEFQHEMFQELANIVEELHQEERLKTHQKKIDLLLEAFSFLLLEEAFPIDYVPSLSEAPQSKEPVGVPLSSAVVAPLSNDAIRDSYLSAIREQQERISKLVSSGDIYKEKEGKPQNKVKKREKIPKKSKALATPKEQSPAIPYSFSLPSKGTIKFRNLAKLIGQMARNMRVEDVRTIVRGSHVSVHRPGVKSVTLVRIHGKKDSSVSLCQAERVLNSFLQFFLKGKPI
jgi:hypothetical protein